MDLGTYAKFCSEPHLWLDCCTFGETPQILHNLVNCLYRVEWDFLRKPFHLARFWYISKRRYKGSVLVVVSKGEAYMGSAETVWNHFLFTDLILLSLIFALLIHLEFQSQYTD